MGYLGQQASFTGTQNNKRISVTANSGQIDFLPTGGYAINAIDVYRNGVKLVGQRDFLALDGVTVTLTQAANSGDTLEFVIYENFVVADVLNGDGDQVINGNLFINGSLVGTIPYASVAGIATEAIRAGMSTEATRAGIASVAVSAGVATAANSLSVGATGTGLNVTGIISATQFSGNITGTAATITGNVTVGGNVSVAGTLTYEDVTNVDSIGLVTARSGVRIDTGGLVVTAGISTLGIATATAFGVSGFSTFAGTSDFRGAIETVSTGSTTTITGTTRVTLECDLANGNIFTHNCLATGADVGIVSLRNFPAIKNSVTTYTIIFTQNATGTGNTTANTGIGTRITLTPLGVTGFTTSARVATASTVTLSTTANDVEIVTLAVHYNGSGTGTPGNYRVFVTNNTGYRFGSVGF
jgi:hypothetical protein